MYRFLLRPAWVLSHVLVAVLLIGTVSAGFWQLRRLDERMEFNATVVERTEEAPVALSELVAATDPLSVGDDLEWRRVEVVGRFDADRVIRVANRSIDGTPGQWWITPMTLTNGTQVLVNRGFVAVGLDASEVAAVPTDEVTVIGVVRPNQEQVGFGGDGREGSELTEVPRIDIPKLADALGDADPDGGAVLPVWLQMQAQSPPAPDVPAVLPPPDLSEGPHFGYAMQWFIFSTIGLIGYPLVLRRVARSQAGVGSAKEKRSQVPIDGPPPIPSSR